METEIKDCDATEKTPETNENITSDSLDDEAVKTGKESIERGNEASVDEDVAAKTEEDILISNPVEIKTSQLKTTEQHPETVSGDNEGVPSNQGQTAKDSADCNTETHEEEEAAARFLTDQEGTVQQPQSLSVTETPESENQHSRISTASATNESIEPTSGTRMKEPNERKAEVPRPRTVPKSYGRATKKDIAEKFGGVATSGIRVQRSSSCGAGAVKNMLLEWCKAKTRGREGVDIQNFSSSWSSGLAFCALILAFFPDAFDYDSLDPKNRRQNFQLAFSTAEKLADCPPLLDVEDMIRMKVPDSKCVYTYVQELYRSLVAKGLVKTKKA